MKKHKLRLAILAVLYAGKTAISGEVTFDGTLAPAGGRAAASLSAANGTYTINQSDGVLRGGNLFHSFGKFNLDAGETGLFTTSSAGVQNVISRVTGGQQSTINGTLRLSALQDGIPNLFFINPSGVTLGSSAVVDVPGSFFLSTANNLTFADGTVFAASAVTNPVLTTAVPQSFGFLTDRPSKISVGRVGSLDLVGKDVTLIGGDIDLVSDGVLPTATFADFEPSGAVADRLAFPSLYIASVAAAGIVPIAVLGQDQGGERLPVGTVLDLSLPPEFTDFARLGKVSFTGPGPRGTSSTDANPNANLAVVADSVTLTGLDLVYGSYRIDARNHISVSQSTFFDTFRGSIQAKLLADFVALTDDRIEIKGRLDIAARQQLRLEEVDIFIGEDRDFQFETERRINEIRFASDGDLVLRDSHFSANTTAIVGNLSFRGRNVALNNTELDFLVFGPILFLASENLELSNGSRILASGSQNVTLNGRNILVADSLVDLRNDRTLRCEGPTCRVFAPRNPESLSIGNCSLTGCATTDSVILRSAQITTAVPGGNADGTNLSRSAPIVISANDVYIESSQIESSSDVRRFSTSVFFTGPDSVFNFSTSRDDDRLGDAGPISIRAANRFTMTGESSRITASTTGRGDAGQLSVDAGSIDISSGIIESRNSMVAEIADKPLGAAGTITLTADRVALGKVTISTDTVTPNTNALPASISITSRQADLTLDGTQISATTSSAAAAGSVTLNSSGAISLTNGATLSTTTTNAGSAGNISFAATNNVSLSGVSTTVSSSSSGTGTAGSIQLGTQTQRLGSLTIDEGATIQASTGGTGAGGSINGFVVGDALVTGPSRISASTTGSGDAGAVSLSAARLEVRGGTIESRSSASGDGQPLGTAGSVTLNADRLLLGAATISTDTASSNDNAAAASITLSGRNELTLAGTQVTATTATGTAAGSITLSNTGGAISLQDNATVATTTNAIGAAGNITIAASGGVAVRSGASVRSESTALSVDAGRAGTIDVTGDAIGVDGGKILASINGGTAATTTADVALTARTGNIDVRNRAQITVDTSGAAGGGNISFVTPGAVSIAGTGTNVSSSSSGTGAAGNIQLGTQTQRIGSASIDSGATVATATNATGTAGNVTLIANDNVTLQSGATIRSESTAMTADAGRAGTINVTGEAITVDGGKLLASINGGSATTPTADVVLAARTGNIDVRTRAQITVDTSGAAGGGNVSFVTPATVALAGTGTTVSSSSAGAGTAGSIQLGTATQRIGSLNVINGAAVQANTGGTGNGGAINVFVAGDATLTGAGSTLASNAADAGDGGTITVDATNVQLADGARIQSTAMSSGDSGAIALNIARDLRLSDSAPESLAAQTAILTSAQQSSGGNITAKVGGNLLLASSRIESSVATAAGKGGDINLQTQGLLLSSSQIFARADQGNGGGITITRRDDLPPGPFLVDANSSINAQSRAAVSGVIAIDATDTNVTTVIDPLAASLAQTPALTANPCSARQSGAPSTFVRDTDGGVAPLPDNYFTAGVLAAPSPTPLAAMPADSRSLTAALSKISPCMR